MMRFRYALLLAAVLLAASAIAGVAQPRLGRSADTPTTTPPAKTITVSGNGTVTTVPDRASFSFTVEGRAQTAAAAIAKSSDAASAVAAAVKGAGAAPADIQTSQVSLSPQTTQDGTTIIGYVASNTISVTSAIGKAGAIVDAAVHAGSDGVSGPSLSRSDATSLYKDALKNAVADAKDKASALAAAAGLTLGGVQSIDEGSSQPPVMWAAAKADAGSVPIEPGTQSITANVTVTYSAD
jgi:uncharacterized protein YggE